jgi:CubicO group peptidase (beta-lactamase class C family)
MSTPIRRLAVVWLAVWSVGGARGHADEAGTARALEELRGRTSSALEEWKVPGAALAVIKDGRILFAEGFGQRDVERGLPATKDTLFAIGSCTKALTAMSVGLVVEDGKLGFDTPVASYHPAFRMKDEVASEAITARDLLCHRSGLPRHDLVWYASDLSRQDLVDRLRYLEPNASFRGRWQYQNLMFMTAGFLAGQANGTTWEELVRGRILEPLGMRRSNFSVLESQKDPDFARPYKEIDDGKVVAIPFRDISTVGPAGSINSSVAEMARWVMLQLGGGEVEGRRLVSAPGLAEQQRAQMVMGNEPSDPEVVGESYAMGWVVDTYRGHPRVWHNGGIDGFTAWVSLLPKDGLGIVMLVNKDGTPLPEVVVRETFDRLLELPAIDWSARFKTRRDAAAASAEKARSRSEGERKAGTRPAHALAEYAADYEHPAYGIVSVTAEAKGLAGRFHGMPLRLGHWHYETFRAVIDDAGLRDERLFAHFVTNTAGDVDALELNLETQAGEIVFARKPPARLSDPAFLAGLAGVYDLADQPGVSLTVTRKGERALAATLPSQPEYRLEPYRGTEFRLAGLTGYSARFVLDAKGAAAELQLVQPEGVFTATRR